MAHHAMTRIIPATPPFATENKRTKVSRRLSLAPLSRLWSSSKESLIAAASPKFSAERKIRAFQVQLILPDASRRTITGSKRQTVQHLLSHVTLEYKLSRYRLRFFDSLLEVDPEADATLLDGDVVLVEDVRSKWKSRTVDSKEDDPRLRLVEEFLRSEEEYAQQIRAAESVYGRPLRKLSSISDEEHHILFGGLESIWVVSILLCQQIKEAVIGWIPHVTEIGGLFSKQLWDQYEEYQDIHQKAKELLRDKQTSDEEFVEFCKLRRGAAKHTLETLLDLPAQRLVQYERFLQQIFRETRDDHPDAEALARSQNRANEVLKKAEGSSPELDRIQDLFPSDNLQLNEKDGFSCKMKGLMRKRSTTASRLQRAFSAKSLRSSSSNEGISNSKEQPTTPVKNGQAKRQFLMETAVQFTTGVQSQERHLFLFDDMLLVAKARPGGNFKLKEKVRVAEMWLATCIDDISEVSKPAECSFVIGWPVTNVVATFSNLATRNLWWDRLNNVVNRELDKEAQSTSIQVVYYDASTNVEYCKTVTVGSQETARDVIRSAVDLLEGSNSPGSSPPSSPSPPIPLGLDPANCQLWVRTENGGDEAPYPLVGHERPMAIRLKCLREAGLLDYPCLDHCNNVYGAGCQFILRNAASRKDSAEQPEGKKPKKNRKSPLKIQKMFRRQKSDVTDSPTSPAPSTGVLYGIPLDRLVEGDKLPKPVMAMLRQLFLKAPFTHGIFRRSANARQVREVRERLDAGADVDLDEVNVVVVAAVFKEFLRSLPDALLLSNLYPVWIDAVDPHLAEREMVTRIQRACTRLPAANVTLLRHFLCVLHLINQRSSKNMMSASNLAVCVGPSLLWSSYASPSTPLSPTSPATSAPSLEAASRAIPLVVQVLIERCSELFGASTLQLMGTPPDKDLTRQDSGAEESDSLHSSGGTRRDDSSIDSLEREFLGEGNEPGLLPKRDKMSLTNLSRDSGLTMSDSQLYTPDEEESESTSSGHSGDRSKGGSASPSYNPSAKATPTSNGYGYVAAKSNGTSVPRVYSPVYKQRERGGDYLYGHNGHGKLMGTYSHPARPIANTHHREDVDVPDGHYATPVSRMSQVQNPNFQRQDWFRRKSNLRRATPVRANGSHDQMKECHQSSVSRHNSLRRSASEESLLSSTYGSPTSKNGNSHLKRPALHRKGRAPPPPPPVPRQVMMKSASLNREQTPPSLMMRSSSVHHLEHGQLDVKSEPRQLKPTNVTPPSALDWQRSRSTPHIGAEADRSYDSSTLSDDDSTPHVSRSNSRGKDCNGSDVRNTSTNWEAASVCNVSTSSSGSRTGSFSTVRSGDSTSTLVAGGNNSSHTSPMEQQQHLMSQRAKMLYEESLRIYQREEPKDVVEIVHAAPVRVDSQGESDGESGTHPPPLPPKEPPPIPRKQRLHRKSGQTVESSESGVTTVVIRRPPRLHASNRPRPVTVHVDMRSKESNNEADKINSPLSDSEKYIYNSPQRNSANVANTGKYRRATISGSIQTKEDKVQTSGDWETGKSITKVEVNTAKIKIGGGPCERRGRMLRRSNGMTTVYRSKSLPPEERRSSDGESDGDEVLLGWRPNPGPTVNEARNADLRSEISWCVSELRAFYDRGPPATSLEELKRNNRWHSLTSDGPPPYRHPPCFIPSSRAPITSYHLGNSQSDLYITKRLARHVRSDSTDSNCGEESYV